MKINRAQKDLEKNGAPMMGIFGGAFAVLMVLLLLINILTHAAVEERLEMGRDEGAYRVGWGASGSGFVVITFPRQLSIIETGETVPRGQICDPQSPFIRYAKKIYESKKQQLIFTILEGGVSTMAEARNCMLKIMPNRLLHIGWIVASNELLKSVSLDDIPAHIKKVVE